MGFWGERGKAGKSKMVTYFDVGVRHGIYALSLVEIILLAQFTVVLSVLLTVNVGVVCWHMDSPLKFMGIVVVGGPIGAALCVTLSHHTWWYAHGLSVVAVPMWLFPLHGLFGHWILDAYWLATLREVRKATLP